MPHHAHARAHPRAIGILPTNRSATCSYRTTARLIFLTLGRAGREISPLISERVATVAWLASTDPDRSVAQFLSPISWAWRYPRTMANRGRWLWLTCLLAFLSACGVREPSPQEGAARMRLDADSHGWTVSSPETFTQRADYDHRSIRRLFRHGS